VTVLDANVLLYAYNADAPQQPAAARWLTDLFRTGEVIGLPWVTIWAFIRICTNPRIWTHPLPAAEAFRIVGSWLALADVVFLNPGARHWDILQSLITEHKATGSLVRDAVLAAVALENGAALASTDQNFARFKNLRWVNPLDQ